jgi:hypothetical protein
MLNNNNLIFIAGGFKSRQLHHLRTTGSPLNKGLPVNAPPTNRPNFTSKSHLIHTWNALVIFAAPDFKSELLFTNFKRLGRNLVILTNRFTRLSRVFNLCILPNY